MICNACKAEILGSPKFCPKCGAKIQPVVAPESKILIDVPDSSFVSSVQAKAASVTANTAVQDHVICPTCGMTNPKSARFCKKDGTPLQVGGAGLRSATPGIAPEAAPQQTQPTNEPSRKPTEISRKALHLAGVALLATTSLAGGVLYWDGYIGDRQGSVGEKINTELKRSGLNNINIIVDKEWKAIAEGTVANQTEKDQALELIKKHGELKAEIIDNIRVKPSRAEMETQLTRALADAGMGKVTAQIDEGFSTVTLNDSELDPERRVSAEQLIISTITAAAGVASVKVMHAEAVTTRPTSSPVDTPPVLDSVAVARSLNEQLRNAGLGGVSALVDANGNANLQGTATSSDDKDRAIQLALSQQGVAGVSDFIKVEPKTAIPTLPQRVAPATQQLSPAPAPTVKLDPAKVEGDINRALRDGGAGNVTAQVADDFSITLKGSATSAGQKNRAFQIVRQFPVRGAPKDRVFVVEQ